MGVVLYVDGTAGSDAANGLTRATAKATLQGVRGALTGVNATIVYIRPGVYIVPSITFNSNADQYTEFQTDPFYPGMAILDFNEDPRSFGIVMEKYVCWTNLVFRNASVFFLRYYFANSGCVVANCFFYSQNASPLGTLISNYASGVVTWVNNSFLNTLNPFGANIFLRNYIKDCTGITPVGDRDHNAYPANPEPNGVNTTGADPGFRDVPGSDFRIDPTTPAYYDALLTGGTNGGRIGATGTASKFYLYIEALKSRKFLTADPTFAQGNMQDSWTNEGPNGTGTYTDGTPGDIIAPAYIPQIDLGTTPAATGGRMYSPVFDHGTGTKDLSAITYGAVQDLPAGAAIDIDDTLPQVIEYRSSDTLFLADAGTPTWNTVSNTSKLNVGHRYSQSRVTLRTGHTNA